MSPLSQPSPNPQPVQALKLAHLRTLSHLWDQAFSIPGTRWRVGLEALVGLLPVGGDVVGLGISIYILWQVVQFGLPKTLLLRMVFNIAIDALVGAIPILGDIFDVTWKANTKNVGLLEAYLQAPVQAHSADLRFLWLVFGGLLLALVTLFTLGVVGLFFLVQALSG